MVMPSLVKKFKSVRIWPRAQTLKRKTQRWLTCVTSWTANPPEGTNSFSSEIVRNIVG